MPTLADIANQVNNTLSQINTNTQDTATTAGQIKGDTADIKLRLDALTVTVQAGTLLLANGLFAILESSKQANALLAANVQQNQGILCWLEIHADLLCRILRRENTQIELATELRAAAVKQELILELVHSRETLEVDRNTELQRKIERCCPPKQLEPEACFQACPEPELPSYEPKGQDWQPPKRGAGGADGKE